ncbi:hypothetical protein BS50DRAFT_582176 [Corynespora cassiicola Philippines]|uniref:Chromo domain-containing protein n=1 Tax=Corynespora cassiicola Philippines TaxID=1448308 RepID=A0A2T2PD77_CORCC|nr:hypothetical protein BS50DRAFT_582176 [Corynespora cassiicola Philippines]
MPPALSDLDSESEHGQSQVQSREPSPVEEKKVPVRKGRPAKRQVEEVPEVIEDAEESEDAEEVDDDQAASGSGEEEEEEYVVEKIVGHRFVGNACEYDVKWQGYDDPADRTWEPEDNLKKGAMDILQEYHEKIGGKPESKKRGKPSKTAAGAKRKGRQSSAPSASATPASTKRVKKEQEWAPPTGSWEGDIDYVDTVEETNDPKTGKKVRYAYVVWQNQKKTQHPLQHIYQKCPQKMLQYYESHLVFKSNDGEMESDLNGNNVTMEDDVL